MRCVVDTNIVVSAVILPISVPRRAVSRILHDDIVLASEPTLDELKEVLFRPKFDTYISREERTRFLAQLASVADVVPIIQRVRECNDPTDDKFLELALNGRADMIITGDVDLLRMNPWRGLVICSPSDYLSKSEETSGQRA